MKVSFAVPFKFSEVLSNRIIDSIYVFLGKLVKVAFSEAVESKQQLGIIKFWLKRKVNE